LTEGLTNRNAQTICLDHLNVSHERIENRNPIEKLLIVFFLMVQGRITQGLVSGAVKG
jgi:hypothetical protein